MKQGIIIKNISNHYDCLIDNMVITCLPKGKFRYEKITPLVGDKVMVDCDKKIINDILPRENYLNRPMVANIDYCLIVTSCKKPDLSLSLLDKQILSCEANKIKPVIITTKQDLLNDEEKLTITNVLHYYEKIGYNVIENNDIDKIKRLLSNKTVALMGQSGAGKSTLINKLDPSLNLETKPISEALGRGVHTTRNTQIYLIDDIRIIDTPGFSSLDVNMLDYKQIKNYFIEFSNFPCEYSDCLHDDECNVKQNVEKGNILKSRYDNYIRIFKECYESRSKFFK